MICYDYINKMVEEEQEKLMCVWRGMKWLNFLFHGETSIDLMPKTEKLRNHNVNIFYRDEYILTNQKEINVVSFSGKWG